MTTACREHRWTLNLQHIRLESSSDPHKCTKKYLNAFIGFPSTSSPVFPSAVMHRRSCKLCDLFMYYTTYLLILFFMKYFLSQLYLLRSLQKYWNTFFVPSCPRNVPFMSNRCLSIFSKIWEFTFLELWGNQHALKKKQYAPWKQTPCCLWFYISAYISTSICSEVLNNRTTTCFVPSECWLAMPSNFLFESIPWLI